MTHLDQAFAHLNRQFAKLRQKYVEFSDEESSEPSSKRK